MKSSIPKSALCAEFLGSMFLVMAAISPIILFYTVLKTSIGVALFANAIAVALVLCALIEIFGPISGAHFNPIVTMIMLLEKKIGAAKAALFILMQFIGGIMGTVLSHIMFFDHIGEILSISDNIRDSYMFPAEIFGSFILILVILLLAKVGSAKAPIVVGFLVGGQVLSTSSMMFANPQVTVARMLTSTAPGIRPMDGLVFIAMQIIGALLAYAVYRLVFKNAIL